MVGWMEERCWVEERHCLGGGCQRETGSGAPALLKETAWGRIEVGERSGIGTPGAKGGSPGDSC